MKFTFKEKKNIRDSIKNLSKENTVLLYKIIKQDTPNPNIIYDKNKVLLNFNELKNTTLEKVNIFLKNKNEQPKETRKEKNSLFFKENISLENHQLKNIKKDIDIPLFSYYMKKKETQTSKEKINIKKKIIKKNKTIEKIVLDKDINEYIMDSYLGYETAGKDFSIYETTNSSETYTDTYTNYTNSESDFSESDTESLFESEVELNSDSNSETESNTT